MTTTASNFGQRAGLWPVRPQLLATLVVLAAGLLRLYRLIDQNIWWDEGWTLWLAQLDPRAIALRTAVDTHPPLHYLLMHYWIMAAGRSAFAGRLFSVFAGMLMVAVMYRLGRLAGGARLGILAALLLALARFHLWWSQDIKNYTLAGVFSLASVWFTLRLLQAAPPRGRARLWAGYIGLSALGLYSHYLAALIFLANNLYAAVVFLRDSIGRRPRRRPPLLGAWSLAQLAVLALFLPWLAAHLRLATTWTAAPPLEFGFFLRLTASLFTLGVIHNIDAYAPVVVGLLALAGLGAAWALRRPANASHGAALLSLLIIGLPPLVIYGLSLTPAAFFAPQITPRYLLIFAPAFLLLLALGLSALRRFSPRVGLTALLLVLSAQAWTVTDYYRTRRWTDEMYTLVNIINAFAQPGDGVLLHTDHDWPVFLYYLRAPIGWDGVLARAPLDEAMASGRAATMASRFKRVWLVMDPDALARDPRHLVEAQLGQRLPRQAEWSVGDEELVLYAGAPEAGLEVPPENFAPQTRRTADLAPGLRLLGFDFPVREALSGDVLHLVTYWDAGQATPVEFRLRGPAGEWRQPAAVRAGQRVRLQADLALPPGADGHYSIEVVAGGNSLTVARLTAEPRRHPPIAAIGTRLDYHLGRAIRLVGYDLPQGEVRAGEKLPVTVFWSSTAPVTRSYKVFVHLVGTEWNPVLNNPLWGQVDRLPLDGDLPTTAWVPGQVVPDAYSIAVDPSAPPGQYQIEVGLYDPVSGARLSVTSRHGRVLGDAVPLRTVTVLAP